SSVFLSCPFSRPTTFSPFLVSSEAIIPPPQPTPTITTSVFGIFLAIFSPLFVLHMVLQTCWFYFLEIFFNNIFLTHIVSGVVLYSHTVYIILFALLWFSIKTLL